MKKHGHHWVAFAAAIVILWHYRSQLLALWQTNIAPSLVTILPPSLASLIGTAAHPLDVPVLSRQGGGDSVNGRNGEVGSENSLAGGIAGFPGGFTGFGGSGAGTIDYSSLASGASTGPYPNGSKSPCSSHGTDGKRICA